MKLLTIIFPVLLLSEYLLCSSLKSRKENGNENGNQNNAFNDDMAVLKADKSLISPKKLYRATLESNGKLVIYSLKKFNGENKDYSIWSSNSDIKGDIPYKLIMQDDGNIVIYDNKGKPTWTSGTNNLGDKPYKLIMEDSGNLVLYDSNNKATWKSNSIERS